MPLADVVCFDGLAASEVLRLASSVERFSEHPIAGAILRGAQREHLSPFEVESFQAVPGKGVLASLGGRYAGVGNEALARALGAEADQEVRAWMELQHALGRSALLVVRDAAIHGGISVADQPRPEAREAVSALRDLGISRVEMLTGDNEAAARAVAGDLGMSDLLSGQLPSEKAEVLKKLRSEGRSVAMVGDGINDAPALALADVGIAMGVAGTGIAVETAGVALMTEDLRKVPEVISLSRRVMKVISQNLWAAALLNAAAILLASLGWLGPVGGALWHNAGSIAVVANSARLIRWTVRRTEVDGAVSSDCMSM